MINMFRKDKVSYPNSRQYSGEKILADEIRAKVAKIGALSFTRVATSSELGPTVYVSEHGSDDNSGTEEEPFATLGAGFRKLSQKSWDGQAVIYIDGNVELASGDYDFPFSPSPGISGLPYTITVRGKNTSCEGPFTVQSVSTWGAPGVSREDLAEIVADQTPVTASLGKMIHMLTGNTTGTFAPIRSWGR